MQPTSIQDHIDVTLLMAAIERHKEEEENQSAEDNELGTDGHCVLASLLSCVPALCWYYTPDKHPAPCFSYYSLSLSLSLQSVARRTSASAVFAAIPTSD